MDPMNNYYEILEVERSASPEEIKKAYKRLAKLHHPDANGGSKQAELKFKQVTEAYQTLSDASARQAYDERLDRKKEGKAGSSSGAGTQAKERRAESGQPHVDLKDMEKQFERFFGYHPKSGEAGIKNKSETKNPVDTTAMFEKYFGIRKK